MLSGHRVIFHGNGTATCPDCHLTGDVLLFQVGYDGCPARPDSIKVSVDPDKIRETLGLDAARQYLHHADGIGMKMGCWAQGAANHVGPEGGTIAELSHATGSWHVVVSPGGTIRAHKGKDWNCETCQVRTA